MGEKIYKIKTEELSNGVNISREEILRNLRLLTSEGMTNAGVLYFAKQPYKYIISSKIRCIHFNDDKRVDILDKKKWTAESLEISNMPLHT